MVSLQWLPVKARSEGQMENMSKLIQGIGTLLIGIAFIWGIAGGASLSIFRFTGNTITVTGKATRAFA